MLPLAPYQTPVTFCTRHIHIRMLVELGHENCPFSRLVLSRKWLDSAVFSLMEILCGLGECREWWESARGSTHNGHLLGVDALDVSVLSDTRGSPGSWQVKGQYPIQIITHLQSRIVSLLVWTAASSLTGWSGRERMLKRGVWKESEKHNSPVYPASSYHIC